MTTIDRAAYAEMVIRCLLLEVEAHALRSRVHTQRITDAECAIVAEMRNEQRMTWPAIGLRLHLSGEVARQRYLKARDRGIA